MLGSARICSVLLLLVGLFPGTSRGLTIEAGDFLTLVEDLRDLSFPLNSGDYVAPSPAEQTQFRALATSLLSGNVGAADAQAAALNYELVQYTDTPSGQVYLGVREILDMGQQTLGWGSYFINQDFTSDVLIQVPHPRFDTNSWDVGGQVFRQADARGFMMAGAHRNANGPGTADVAHLTNTIFHQVHEIWNGVGGETPAWSIHGFASMNHPSFPLGTDVVLSNGDGGVSPEIVEIDARFSNQGFLSYAYNTLPELDPLNVAVNDGIDGTTFAGLGATTNVQGIYSRSLGGVFVHIEMEQSIRMNEANRQLAANAISSAILSNLAIPEPASGVSLLFGLLLLFGWKRRRTAA